MQAWRTCDRTLILLGDRLFRHELLEDLAGDGGCLQDRRDRHGALLGILRRRQRGESEQRHGCCASAAEQQLRSGSHLVSQRLRTVVNSELARRVCRGASTRGRIVDRALGRRSSSVRCRRGPVTDRAKTQTKEVRRTRSLAVASFDQTFGRKVQALHPIASSLHQDPRVIPALACMALHCITWLNTYRTTEMQGTCTTQTTRQIQGRHIC